MTQMCTGLSVTECYYGGQEFCFFFYNCHSKQGCKIFHVIRAMHAECCDDGRNGIVEYRRQAVGKCFETMAQTENYG